MGEGHADPRFGYTRVIQKIFCKILNIITGVILTEYLMLLDDDDCG